jgi:DNA-binding ferritin-like protein (Dps family)
MLNDDEVKKIWKENEKRAEKLADAYYDSVIENYPKNKSSKENFGYNTFIDGIRLGLDNALA